MRDLFPTRPGLHTGDDLRDILLVRTRPQMSLHRLAQYVETTVSRRRNLIHYEKHPSPFRVSYAAAERLFGEALRLDWDGDRFYSLALQRWSEHRLDSRFAIRHRDLAIAAAAEFATMLDTLRRSLASLRIAISPMRQSLAPLDFAGVAVGDSPSLVLHRERRGVEEIGLLSFHVSKTRPHDEGSARTAAVLLYEMAGKNQEMLDEIIDPGLCVVVDVFSGIVADANIGRKRRTASARLACEEINTLWPLVDDQTRSSNVGPR